MSSSHWLGEAGRQAARVPRARALAGMERFGALGVICTGHGPSSGFLVTFPTREPTLGTWRMHR